MNGTSSLSFEGLTFSYATWLAPSGGDGYVSIQSGFMMQGWDQSSDVNTWVPGDPSTALAALYTLPHPQCPAT